MRTVRGCCPAKGAGSPRVMMLDWLHGMVRRDFVAKFGFPFWFPTTLGLYKLAQLALNWVDGGAYIHISQLLFAFQLGGVVFTHAVVEKPSPGIKGFVPAAVFFSTTLAVQTLNGKLGGLPMVLAAHLALAVCGYATGFAILALGSGSSAAVAMSPVKWRKKRGF